MSNGNSVRFVILVQDSATGAITAVKTQFASLANSPGVSAMKTGFGAGIGMQLIQTAMSGIHDALSGVIGGAVDEEAAMAKLSQAFVDHGKSLDEYRGQVEKVIDDNIKLGFSETDTTNSLARFIATSGDMGKAQQYMAAAMDLARLKGITLAEATDALTRTEAGQYRMLTSLGIKLPANATAMQALAAVENAAGGQAQAFADTTAGSMAAAGAAIQKLEADFGSLLIPAINAVATALTSVALPAMDNFASNSDQVHTAVGLLIPLIAVGLVNALKAMGKAAYESLGPWGLLLVGVTSLAEAINTINPPKSFDTQWVESFAAQVKDGTVSLLEFVRVLNDPSMTARSDALKADTQVMTDLGVSVDQTTGKFVIDMPAIAATSADTADTIASAMGSVQTAVQDAGSKMVSDLAQSLHDMAQAERDGRDALVKAMQETISDVYDPLENAAEQSVAKDKIAADQKALTAKHLTQEQKDQLNLQLLQDQEHYASLLADAAKYGSDSESQASTNAFLTSDAFIAALNSKDPAVRDAAAAQYVALTGSFSPAAAWGYNTGKSFSLALADGVKDGSLTLKEVLERLSKAMKAASPPGPESPLHLIDQWGYKTGKSYMDGMVSGISDGSGGLSQSLGGLAPAFAGGASGGRSRGGGGITLNLYGPVYGDGPFLDKLTRELAQRLRLAGIG